MIETSATREAGEATPDLLHARKLARALRAAIEVRPLPPPHRKGESMAARFARDPEIAARFSPLRSVRRNTPPTSAKVRKQVRELMKEGPLNLWRAMFAKPRVQADQLPPVIGAACGAAQTPAPRDVHLARDGTCA